MSDKLIKMTGRDPLPARFLQRNVLGEVQGVPVVWILSRGEFGEGGTIRGVFGSKEAAKGPFLEVAKNIPFDLDRAWQDEDGAVHAEGGCDWVSLEPHPVTFHAQLTGSTTEEP